MAKTRTITPVVRYMIPCEEVVVHPHDLRVSIVGLITNLVSTETPRFPANFAICVFLALTNGRSRGTAKIVCIDEESGDSVFESRPRVLEFGDDPLEVKGFNFRMLSCRFPHPGVYSFQFQFDDQPIEQRLIRVR